MPFVTIITSSFNSKRHIGPFFEAVLQTKNVKFEIIAVDDGSTDGSAEVYRRFQKYKKITVIILDKNRGASYSRNLAAKNGTGGFIAYFDIDARVKPDTVSKLVDVLKQNKNIATAQAVLLMQKDGAIESSGHFLTLAGFPRNDSKDYSKTAKHLPIFGTRVAYVTRRSTFEKIGGYDEDYKFHAEDTDISWRTWKTGKEIHLVTNVEVLHLQKSSLNKQTSKYLYYEGCKNMLNMLLKNLPPAHMVIIVPIFLIIWFVILIKVLITGKFNLAVKIFLAVFWNIKNLNKTISKRQAILRYQKRTVDNKILFGEVSFNEFISKGLLWLKSS